MRPWRQCFSGAMERAAAPRHLWAARPTGPRRPVAFLQVKVVPRAKELKDSCYREVMISVRPDNANPGGTDGSFHSAISSVLVAAQCFALMPVEGITSANTVHLRYRWYSVRTLYTCCTLCGAFITTFLCCLQLTKTGLTFNNSLFVVFSTSTLLALLLFLQLARRWPRLLREWERVEEATNTHYGRPTLKNRFRLITAAVLLLALVEHILANTRAVEKSVRCSHGVPMDVVRAFFIYNFHFVFLLVGYSHWKGLLLAGMNIIKTFSWSYVDLFIMLVSVALADRFQALNKHLHAAVGQVLPPTFWRRVREDYNMLANLTKSVDSSLSKIVLLSFGSNLYFICFQVLNSMRPLRDFNEALYFYWSIVYLLLKTSAVSLCAARIHDHSLEPKSALYSVPSEGYCTEVQRFLAQLTTNEVALTGLNFFSVTRAFIMTVAGTIVTYEVVLMQFNMAADLSPIPVPNTNSSEDECQWLISVQY